MSFLKVFVEKATNVPNVETFGKSDPYVTLEYQGMQKKTEVIKGELNPEWKQTLEFDLMGNAVSVGDELKVYVKDWELVGRNRLLGQATVSLKDLSKGQTQMKLSLKLNDSNGRPTPAVLNLHITYNPPASAKAAGQAGTEVTVGAPPDKKSDGEYDDEEEEDEEEEEEDAGDGAPTVGPDGKVQRKKKKKKKRSKRRLRGTLSSKPQDFQIRIKIVEARQLQGANISPVTRLSCAGQMKQTRVQKSTNSPFWNEVFFFNFHSSPVELFDELVTFQVYNSRKLRSDAFIGSFKCDIGMIYDEPQHSLINKWLLLSDPDDHLAGARGYLKICATILGPGDDPPSFKSSAQDEDEDIESNLLRPAGVMLRPATFKLRIYRAEDIPRMDSDFMQGVKSFFGSDEKKELVDPYVIFSFAGQEVKSKIMYSNDHPEFNQELNLGIKFPSMCERLKLQMMDWDRITEDDCIASVSIGVSAISRSGDEGFLPTFGPCFLNFYGSTREYSDLPDEYDDLNLGKGEGVAYRGRALVELVTVLGESPVVDVEDLNQEDQWKVQKFMRRRKYKLHAAFLNATMVSEVDAPVEFEVSIGNYGNKLDESVPPCSSTTQPTNAVFDGCHYYFLPWGDTKPCVVVDSSWEDISFRLETMNLLEGIIERLETNMEHVRVGLQANLEGPEQAQLMITLLDTLIADCRKPLPVPEDGRHVQNDLDIQLRSYRETELKHVLKESVRLRENATDVGETLQEVEAFLGILKNTAVEPQNSMPDVVIWMISGTKRTAYFRCPAQHLLWSANPDYRGKFCGKLETINLKYPGNKAEKDNKWEIPALLRLKIWLGLEKHESEWHKMQTEGDLAVFAETYENQVSILGTWTNKGPTMTRPKWSDATGKVGLKKEDFEPPPGWRWDGEWYISPEMSMLYDKDAGHKIYMEDVYECQSRIPGGSWKEASVPWTDVKGDASASRQEVELPAGWEWEDAWMSDLNRAVDEEGWEYTVEATLGGYGPVEKTYHMCRRRRWVRTRKLVTDVKAKQQEEKLQEEAAEGWEYAPLFNMKFHFKERKMDLVRRRRWHRKMVAESANAPCFFNIMEHSDDDGEEKYKAALTAPRMFLTMKKPQKYQLRAYIYQARDLLAGDSNGLSDPFARVVCLNQSQVTEKLDKTLCPTWDQTLIYDQLEIHGDPSNIAEKPPEIIIEIFDHDTFGSAEFLGRCCAYPIVKLDPADPRSPVLKWFKVMKGAQEGGELLAAFELFLLDEEKLLFHGLSGLTNGKDLPFLPPKRGNLYHVPNGVRPVLQRTGIEVLCWGVRNMKKFQLGSVTSPNIEFEIGGHMLSSKTIKNTKRNPNFDDPLLFFDVLLPREELYTPPLNIRVRDNRQFGRKPMVGIHVVRSLEEFRCNPLAIEDGETMDEPDRVSNGGAAAEGPTDPLAPVPTGEHIIEMPKDEKSPILLSSKEHYGTWKPKLKPKNLIKKGYKKLKGKKHQLVKFKKMFSIKPQQDEVIEEEIDWWSKYYASVGELDKCKSYTEKGYDLIEIFNTELEKVETFSGFNDFCHTFELYRGKNIEDEESNVVGELKGTIRLYPLPGDPHVELPEKILSNLPPSTPEECIVRVYVIKATDLQPNDPSGLADPYVSIKLGKSKKDNQKDYVPNSLNPVWGKMFELKATLPMEKDLSIQIKDYDVIGTDDVIGETNIDLENRFLSKHRALCGLPKTYCANGPTQWRDNTKPKDLLEEMCKTHHLPAPMYSGNTVVRIGSRSYQLSDFEEVKPDHPHLGAADQRLALYVCHVLSKAVGAPVVPEHVETRPLYNPLQPAIEQGKLQMWVDIFPSSVGPPGPPIDITPRKPKKYELRVIVWNTEDVILEETSITGEQMSDIYVKSWLSGIDEKQETDVHYRSLDGEGNFNWRMVFPFEYIPAEETMVVKKKEHFWSLDERELHLAPNFIVQIWDNDKFSADDFLGTLELNLNKLPKPAKSASKCTLDMVHEIGKPGTNPKEIKTVSIFEQKRVKGFWPCYSEESGERTLTGKVELEIELVPEDEAKERPVGLGQDEPNQHPHLDPPKRPETSFLWFTSPFKTLKFIIWRRYKWYFIIGLIVILLVLLIILFIYTMPGALSNKVVSWF